GPVPAKPKRRIFCCRKCKERGRPKIRYCRVCNKPFPWPWISTQRYCSIECQKKSWEKQCAHCGNTFIPKEKRVICCSRSCAASWKWNQPEIAKKFIENRMDPVEFSKLMSRTALANKP